MRAASGKGSATGSALTCSIVLFDRCPPFVERGEKAFQVALMGRVAAHEAGAALGAGLGRLPVASLASWLLSATIILQ